MKIPARHLQQEMKISASKFTIRLYDEKENCCLSSSALLRILHHVLSQLLDNTRQSRGQPDEITIIFVSDYLYLLIQIVENSQFFD